MRRSTACPYAECSTTPSVAGLYRNISAPITTRCFASIAGLANLRVLELEEIKSVPYAPVSHPFVERLIGTIRREYLDRVFFWNAVDLARKLEAFRDYYNRHCVHRALAGLTPAQRAGAPSPAAAAFEQYAWQQHCRGLFHIPIAA